ncbi:MAG: dehydrogenase, partial [Verrucomicrobiota bacterium]
MKQLGLLTLLLLLGPQASFAIQVAETEPLAPEEQRQRFTLPEGFDIQLVVSEPDIGQPMNLNLDARGRLWISHSIEYPFPARGEGVEGNRGRFAGDGHDHPRDRLTRVEIGPDGAAKQLSHFATGLNIPIGQTPMGDGSRALVYGIPSIFDCADEDGDGVAETKKTLFTGFGNRDTHGMANSFTRWIDGWIYGCHGFANTSEIEDGEGRVTSLSSGNTYRFKADGSRFESFTFGQVNPFGMTFDPWGNLYDADCHSKPVYLLLRGARYPHFGNKPDALGFGPTMIDHNHGSTGVCGPAYYAADRFPEDYRDNLFICNPVSEKVHRDKLVRFGSTLFTDTQPDFITCDDPWFRPVDAIVGPDGALYIADFYNAIIGHYEQPLTHPKRDRIHGRVWRVVFGDTPPPEDLVGLSEKELLQRLDHPNLAVRVAATHLLVERGVRPSI